MLTFIIVKVFTKQAIEVYEKASDLYVDAYGGLSQHPKQAHLYDLMAFAYKQYGAFDKAMEFYQYSLNIFRETLPSEHPNLAQCYNNIGLVFYDQGDSDPAFEYFQMSLTIYELIGYRHSSLATVYSNLAVIYSSRHDYNLAMEYHERAINLCREILPENHQDPAARYVDFAATLIRQREFDKAMSTLNQAKTIYESHDFDNFSLDHLRYAYYYTVLADFHLKKDYFDQAFQFSSEALHIRQNYLRADHPLIAANLHNLGSITS